MADVLDGVPLFITPTELENKLGQLGIDVANSSGPADGVTAACTWATDFVWFYCQREGPFEALQASRMVRNWAKVCGAYHWSSNNGEPHIASFKEDFDVALQQLQMVADGKMDIPGLPTIPGQEDKGGIPVVSAMAVDPTTNPSMRVNRPSSTGTPAGYPVAPYYPGQYPRRNY